MYKLKEKIQSIDWWTFFYLLIYGTLYIHEFEHTTMFKIQWPSKMGYVFIILATLYTLAKFIWKNTYTKKEMIFAVK